MAQPTITAAHVTQRPNGQFFRVAAAVPVVRVGDVEFNLHQTLAMWTRAADAHVAVVAFPELGLCGYTIADLVHNHQVVDNVDVALRRLVEHSKRVSTAAIVGAPLAIGSKLYNVAVVIAKGAIVGIVPKTWLPTYGEFYESRWFASGAELEHVTTTRCGGFDHVPVSASTVFRYSGVSFSVELCEDLWVASPPSVDQVRRGSEVVFNLSASNEVLGKDSWRRTLISAHSGKLLCGYVYCSAGTGESVADTVFGGHAIIAESGHMITQSERLSASSHLTTADLDVGSIRHDRWHTSTFAFAPTAEPTVEIAGTLVEPTELDRQIDSHPFVPNDPAQRTQRCEEILAICQRGLLQAMLGARVDHLVLGLSGGLDSTLAILTAVRALDTAGLPRTNLTAIVMPGPASSDRTQSNAQRLAQGLGVTTVVTPIDELTATTLAAIGHDGVTQNITYENTQARIRTLLLMNTANLVNGFVVGTGDMSELALGWCTYNGDHMSMYNVNVGVPKTLVRHLVATAATWEAFGSVQPQLHDIIDTPISPELTSHADAITQHTEDVVGPYELADFFLFRLIRHGDAPDKIAFLAGVAFDGIYDSETIAIWLNEFLIRFTRSQFKRDVVPNGPKVGSVALSPRADWRMSPQTAAWFRDIG